MTDAPTPNARYDHGYAILRLDLCGADYDPLEGSGTPAFYVTVEKIVRGAAQVSRLNELSKEKRCSYLRRITRVEKR